LAGRISDLSSNKLDATAFSDVSGTFLTAHQDLSDYQTTADMTAYQPVGSYLTTADSAEFYTTANESGFITGVDLTPYQEKADMTAYQPAGSYLSSTDSANFLLTSDSGNFYPMNENPSGYLTAHQSLADYQLTADMTGYLTTADSANFLTGVPAGTMNESAFDYNVSNRITGYNGSAFAQGGGSDLDFGYDESGAISAINTSALSDSRAGTPLYVESPLFTGQSGDSAYIGSDINETLLASSTDYYGAGELNLSESLKNFERIKVLATRGNIDQSAPYGFSGPWIEFETDGIISTAANIGAVTPFIFEGPFWKYGVYTANADFTKLTWWAGGQKQITTTAAGTTANSFTGCVGIKAVIGINRKRI
jgi:hypothetical protein